MCPSKGLSRSVVRRRFTCMFRATRNHQKNNIGSVPGERKRGERRRPAGSRDLSESAINYVAFFLRLFVSLFWSNESNAYDSGRGRCEKGQCRAEHKPKKIHRNTKKDRLSIRVLRDLRLPKRPPRSVAVLPAVGRQLPAAVDRAVDGTVRVPAVEKRDTAPLHSVGKSKRI